MRTPQPSPGATTVNIAYPTANCLRNMVQDMVDMGPRLTGSPEHKNFIEYLARRMSALGLEVTPDCYKFTRWEPPLTYSLSIDGSRPVPLAGYFPYSGSTGPQGIQGNLVSADLPSSKMVPDDYIDDLPSLIRKILEEKWKEEVAAALAATEVRDAIVLVSGFIPPIRKTIFLPFLTYAKNADLDRLDPSEFEKSELSEFEKSEFKRPWLGGQVFFEGVLDVLRGFGAAGAVFHLDASRENAQGQYLPFSSALNSVPAVLVDRDVGNHLRKRASSCPKARLTLDANTIPNTCTDSLVATLPGARYKSKRDRCIIINTHTDGQNAIEENGAIACLAIAQHYADIPREQRPRTLVFSLVTGHMGPKLPQTQGFVDRFPDLVRKATCAITIEHLGATEWIDDDKGYRATGRPEFAAAFHSETPISRYVTRSYKDKDNPLTGIGLLRPVFDTPIARFLARQNYLAELLRPIFETRGLHAYLGVGAPLHQAGVPSIGYLTGPNYLVSNNHEMDKFDPERMRCETEWIIKTLHCLERAPAWKLRQNTSFRHILGLLVFAISLAFVGVTSIIEAVRQAEGDAVYLLPFVCVGLILSLAFSILVYALVRFLGWIVLYFTTLRLWRARIKRHRDQIRKTRPLVA